MTQAQPESPPLPPADVQVRVGPGGRILLPTQSAEAGANLTAQAELLKSRIQALTKEIAAVKAEMSAPGAGPIIASSQVRLTGLEERRSEAEEALQRVEDQRAGIGNQPAFTTEVGAPADLPAIPFDPNQSAMQDKITIVAVAAIVCVGMPIAVAIARNIWKRTTARALPAAASNTADAARLERVEQAVDAIAVEVERMSEGQRYVTKLLAERVEQPR